MATAILLAGGVGERLGAGLPKQFLEVAGKPLICYSLETLNDHPLIEAIEIVCVHDYIDELWKLVKKNNYEKVKWITEGGDSCQSSTRNGLSNLRGKIPDDEIVIIHMAAYPLAKPELFTNVIECAKKHGNGCTARKGMYTFFPTEDGEKANTHIPRDNIMCGTVPYAFRFKECADLYDKAYKENKGVQGSAYTNTLYCEYGKTIYFTPDILTNLKVTTPEDIALMEIFMAGFERMKVKDIIAKFKISSD